MKRLVNNPLFAPFLVLAVLLLLLGSVSLAAEESGATLSAVEGKVLIKESRSAEWKDAAAGAKLEAEYYLKTEKGARAEIKLPDGSIIRVAPDSQIRMKSLIFSSDTKKGGRDFNMQLEAGKIWANVSKALGGDAKFKVETSNATAGVRGTVFQVGAIGAAADVATVVKVYSGAVAVMGNAPQYQRKGDEKTDRVQVQGPQQVTKEKWEELVAQAMQQVKVAANGSMSLEGFAMEDEAKDEWVAWNLEKDKALQK